MSCTICQTKFSFFTKEVACPGCGYSCCTKCLKYKCAIPDRGVKKVCGRCFHKHDSKKMPDSVKNTNVTEEHGETMAPVDIATKVDSLENPAKPPIVMYKHTNHWDKFKKGLEPEDQEIVDRLRKLKEKDKSSAPSVDEIKRRLALLKDEDPDASSRQINIHEADTRTDQQKADDLIQEYLDQLELPSGSDSVNEIQTRLRSLQGIADKPHMHSSKNIDKEEDEEQITKKLIAKALAEAELEKKYEVDVDELEEMEAEETKHLDCDEEEDEDEKFNWMMYGQTKYLEPCVDCNGDLYCPVCYEDNYEEFERRERQRRREPISAYNLTPLRRAL